LLRREDGAATVEFVLLFPVLFAVFLTSIDFSIMMLRQVSLDRALDLAVRDVRLGRVPANGFDGFRDLVCGNVMITPNCAETITIEMRAITPETVMFVNPQAVCVNRAEALRPELEFNPAAGEGELVMIRACTVSNPFIAVHGWIWGGPRGPNDDFMSVSTAFVVNEPA
jgi:Flp pilus assembly protein TadG